MSDNMLTKDIIAIGREAVAIQRWVDVTGGTPELVEPVMQVEAD